MALTAHDISSVHRLAKLAAHPGVASKAEIYLAVTSLYRVEDVRLTPRERALIHDILRQLTKDVEMSIRISLAQKLADDPSAPYELITMLADDRIEVARPVILRSPLLLEKDLLHLALECSEGHQVAVASRPNIGESITEALSKNTRESVLMALVRNATARLSHESFVRLSETAKRIEPLCEPLARREDLPSEIGMQMCGYVSETLKAFILNNYSVRLEKLQNALDATQTEIRQPRPATTDDDKQENADRLIDKLYTAGQLKAGFLVRILRQGDIELFELGLSRMLDVPLTKARQILYEMGPTTVALACRATGIDRSVFSTIYIQSRRARSLPSGLTQSDTETVETAFRSATKTEALRRLQSV